MDTSEVFDVLVKGYGTTIVMNADSEESANTLAATINEHVVGIS